MLSKKKFRQRANIRVKMQHFIMYSYSSVSLPLKAFDTQPSAHPNQICSQNHACCPFKSSWIYLKLSQCHFRHSYLIEAASLLKLLVCSCNLLFSFLKCSINSSAAEATNKENTVLTTQMLTFPSHFLARLNRELQ